MDPTIADSLYHGTFPQVPSRPSPSSAWPPPSRAGTPRSGIYAFPLSALPASFADWRLTPRTSKPTKTFTPPAANPAPRTTNALSPPAGPAAPCPQACLVTGLARCAPPPPASCSRDLRQPLLPHRSHAPLRLGGLRSFPRVRPGPRPQLAAQYEVLLDCCSWLAAAWAAYACHRTIAARFIISVPIHLNGQVIWFYDDQSPPLQALTSARVSYRISSRAPGRRLWLTQPTPVSSPAIWARYCPSCCHPRVPEAWASPPPSPLSLPNAFCLFPSSGLTHLNSELAARSTVLAAGFPPVVGVPAAPVRPGLPCYSPDHSVLHPSTPWALALADNTFSPLHLHRHAGLTFLTWNVGCVDALVDYVCNMLIALDIDYFALQELWSFDSIVAAMPTHHATFRSAADGCGTRALVGGRRSLQHPSTRPGGEYDSHDLLVALMRHHTAGFVLVASVHVHSDLDYKARRALLINLMSLAHYLRPNVELVGGDFNMSRTNSRHPLASACCTGACMARYRPAFPADAPTDITTTQHRHTATSIDHIFVRGARSIISADILPSPTPHRPLVATVEPPEGLTDVRSLRHVRWRLAPEGTIPA